LGHRELRPDINPHAILASSKYSMAGTVVRKIMRGLLEKPGQGPEQSANLRWDSGVYGKLDREQEQHDTHIRYMGTRLRWDTSRLHNGLGFKTAGSAFNYCSISSGGYGGWHLAWAVCFQHSSSLIVSLVLRLFYITTS
jgi:hypothetical protein